MELAGKVAIVAGGAGNIGSACSRRLAEAGAAVVIFDIPGKEAAGLANEIVDGGGRAIGYEGDISDEQSVKGLIAACMEAFGRIDTLVNIAAALHLCRDDRDLVTMDADYWDQVMAVNARGPMLTCKHALPAMLAQGSGSIVNFTSTAAFAGDRGLIAYGASKGAVQSMTTGIATTYGRSGIRCNVIAPSGVWGEHHRELSGAERIRRFSEVTLTPRLGEPDDVAHLIVYLASDKSSYITGQTFFVDGGGLKHQPWVRGATSVATDRL